MVTDLRYSPKGKYVTVNDRNPKALGICDYSGFVFNRVDMVRQMEWRGNSLVWTGMIVGKPFADKPNEQGRAPILPPDPIPVTLPRLPQGSTLTHGQNQLPVHSAIQQPASILGSVYDGYNYSISPLQALQNFNWGSQ
jgi:hypothetical protein